MVGGPQCTQPYDMALLNVSAMSFGALSAHAIEALNAGAAMGGFLHDTGEGAISPYHLKHGGDLNWEVASGYFGCRTKDGHFDADQFEKKARGETVKTISVKLSQGAKPGLGGVLPGAKVNQEIADTRGVPIGKVATGIDIVKRICQGADFTRAARAMTFSIGCIQAQTVASAHQIVASMGLASFAELHPGLLNRRQDHQITETYADLHEWLSPGQLMTDPPEDWINDWELADPGDFGTRVSNRPPGFRPEIFTA